MAASAVAARAAGAVVFVSSSSTQAQNLSTKSNLAVHGASSLKSSFSGTWGDLGVVTARSVAMPCHRGVEVRNQALATPSEIVVGKTAAKLDLVSSRYFFVHQNFIAMMK